MSILVTRRALLALSAAAPLGLAASAAFSEGVRRRAGQSGGGGHIPGGGGHMPGGGEDSEHSHDEAEHSDTDHEHTEHDPDSGDHEDGKRGPQYRGGRAETGHIADGRGHSLEDRVLKKH